MKKHIKGLIWLYEGELFLIIIEEGELKNFIMLLIHVLIDGCIFEKQF
jgi:hypothetical protein